MPFGDPLFEGRFDPNRGWTNTNSTSTAGRIHLFVPGPNRNTYSAFDDPEPLEIDNPMLVGPAHQAMATTETGLTVSPEIIHDANGYYRAFGYSFPFLGISIKEMRLRYLEIDGPNSEWLTHILKTLRNVEQRRIYDRVPFWERYMDKYMQDWIKRRAMEQAKEFNAQRAPWEDEKEASDVLKEMGFGIEPDEGDDAEVSDSSDVLPDEGEIDVPWTYSYYVWRSSSDDTERLARWQELLLAEFVRAGMKTRFAVGFMGRNPREWVSGEAAGNTILFLNDEIDPTEEMAAKAVASFVDEKR